ncbi:MAG: PPC domain-containing protein [Planctomycetia bacterium]|nr:PPC domain-containing protein [Planctomycetia bacterium]
MLPAIAKVGGIFHPLLEASVAPLFLFTTFGHALIAMAAPPELDLIVPQHFTRGKTTIVRCFGKNMGPKAQLVLPFAAEVRETSASDSSPSFSVTPAPDALLGVHPIRLRTTEGISNLRLTAVSDMPVVVEQEPNDREEQAQRIEVPVVVTGPLDHPARDTELFRFSAVAGQRLTFVTQTRQLGLSPDLRMSLYDAHRHMLATAEGTPGMFEDERIDYTFPTAGEYFLKVHDADYNNVGWTNHYNVKIGPMNYVRTVFPLGGRRGEPIRVAVFDRDGEQTMIETRVPANPIVDYWRMPLDDFPGSLPWPLAAGEHPEVLEADLSSVTDQSIDARHVDWPTTINGRIEQPEEQDSYLLKVKPGQKIRAVVDAYYLGSPLDGHLLAYDPLGKKLLAQNNDMHLRGNVDPGLWFEVPAGVTSVVVSLRDVFGRGGREYPYRLTIETGGPDFLLSLGKENFRSENDKSRLYDRADTLNLRLGKTETLPISVARGPEQAPYHFGPLQGFTGPITVRCLNAPPGITIESITIAAGKTEGALTVLAADNAPRTPFELTIIGEALRDDGTKIFRVAERRLFLCEPAFGNMKWNYVSRQLTCLVLDPQTVSAKPASEEPVSKGTVK